MTSRIKRETVSMQLGIFAECGAEIDAKTKRGDEHPITLSVRDYPCDLTLYLTVDAALTIADKLRAAVQDLQSSTADEHGSK